MRLHDVVLIIISIITSCVVIVAGDASLYARQADQGSTTTSAISSSVLSTTNPSATSTSASSASEATVSATASASTTVTDRHPDITTGTVAQATALEYLSGMTLTVADAADADALPIQPKITPALGVAGVILIVLGLCYSLIGIKNQWIHVFLSAAFSTSLAVTVLIVYVMSPPVRNAVQGAYFVAAFFTGVIFGALSLVFKELTEGLGCLLGGFCLSMWILCLKAGGVITSSGAKGGFIGAFCAAAYALSFSLYTRPYALIGSTAFAGGTATVLGIDCFSRAGLKEFWLYIWDLNDNIFPLDTTTYPVTRGIRVELAIIIIICLMGLLSQFRLWRVVRERRKKQAALLKEEQRKKDEAEAEMGRRFEENNMRELARWEAIYGNRETRQPNSGGDPEDPESPRKCSTATEVAEAPGDTVEMKNLTQSGHDSTQPTTTDETAHEKEPKGDATGPPDTKDPENPSIEATGKEKLVQKEGPHPIQEENPPAQTDALPVTPAPVVTPLPFKVPDLSDTPKEEDRHSVQATCDDVLSIATRLSKRLSGNTLLRRLSNRTSNLISSSSEEMLVPIRLASPATSVQGIVDGDEESEFDLQTTAWELDALEGQQLPSASCVESRQEGHEQADSAQEASDVTPKVPVQNDTVQEAPLGNDQPSENHQEVAQEEQILPRKTYQPEPSHEVTEEQQVSARDGSTCGLHVDSMKRGGLETVPEKRQRPINAAARVLPAGQVFPLSPVTSVPSKSFADSDNGGSTVKKSPSLGSRSQTNTGRKTSLTAGAVEKLPSHVSPVVTSYRTNEWAKHLAEAETPEVEPIQLTQDDSAHMGAQDTEVAAPVRVEELQQTAMNAPPPPPPPASERCVSLPEEPVSHPVYRSLSSASRYASRDSSRIYSPGVYADGTATQATSRLAREPAAPGLARSSQAYPAAQRGLHGSPSGFFNNSLASAPIRESEVANFPETPADEPPSLMAQRESMVQSRMSSVSLSRDSWLPRSYSRLSLDDGRRESQLGVVPDDDDIPLAQRRAWLQQGGAASHGRMTPDPKMAMRDPYQANRPWREPNRTKSQMTMAAWRQALREDLTQSRTPLADVTMARTSMMEQQRKAQLEKQQRKMASEYIDNSIAEKMQRGEMRDLHREALRRMQAAANRKVMGGE
ncbi:hypothetical protein T310_0779 [Rasamsonia emersonii CBS 393.64]|uniref:TM7S3/TM198-like domain-containing protein n=1 Tax=Rasamsonia emersonii (strain ATCC 16479 / CBS 393.64 / IMI 116815) TaxID=1408163 RepID=A0A0F4Z5P4_RASE3|nr:hypothetical protein T310_0779 [Rasamsonia emersonii CBS 393.64]KKA25188.1 hypothetical protein T310_0779 [Rasamsonia emersonii CBS 393.64]